LILAAVLITAGSKPRLPQPFGPAANGLLAYEARGGIFTIDPATGVENEVPVGVDENQFPNWSRDGTRLFFLRTDGAGHLPAVVDANGTNLVIATERLLQIDSDTVAWSPDGRHVAFGAWHQPTGLAIYLFDTQTGAVTILPGDYAGLQLFWRPPDGRHLLFVGETDAGLGLFVVSVDRPAVEQLPLPAGETAGLRPQGWTADGQGVAYVFGALDARDTVDDDVTHVLDLTTGTATTVPAPYGQISNDGTRIAGFTGGLANPQLCVADLSGGPCRRIGDRTHAAHPTHHKGIEWSPDDRWILSKPTSGARAVLIDPITGDIERPAWLPTNGGSWQRAATP
jgi:Tol biopolymer transport system component